jgi:hypothetical protein
MKRPAIFAALDLGIGLGSLFQGKFSGERHDAQELRSVALEARQVHPGQVERRDLPSANKPPS